MITKSEDNPFDLIALIRTAVVIDDMPTIRQVLCKILENMNVHVMAQASRAGQGIELCERLRPSLVCLDIGLPDGCGLDVLAQIKQRLPHTKVIMISGDCRHQTVLSAMRAGADDFIVKPFNAHSTQRAINNILESNNTHRQH